MSTSTIAFNRRIKRRRSRRSSPQLLPVLLGGLAGAAGLALVGYLLWPTWKVVANIAPSRLPISVGGTAFDIPRAAIRIKAQRHTGQQERIDLAFLYPSLDTPPVKPPRVDLKHVPETLPEIDRIFLSVFAHHNMMSPEERVRDIYARYIVDPQRMETGLLQQSFRPESPYRNEDLFSSEQPAFLVRCTRDEGTPGMCMSERRIGGADLTFRFPRRWLSQWRDVAAAMDKLVLLIRGRAGR